MQTVTIGGKTYPILFDANVLAKVQERYGSVDELWEKMKGLSEMFWVLAQTINEARRYREVMEGAPQEGEEMTGERVGMLFTRQDLANCKELVQAIITAFNEGMGGRKNQKAGQGKKKHRGGKKRKPTSTLPGSNTSQ